MRYLILSGALLLNGCSGQSSDSLDDNELLAHAVYSEMIIASAVYQASRRQVSFDRYRRVMNTATPEQYLEVAKCFRDAAAQKTNDPEWYRFRVKEAVANALLDADAVSEYWPLARASDQVSEIRASAMRDAVGDLCGPGNQNCTYNLLYDIDGRTATPNYGLAAYAEAEAIGIDKYELDECSLILFPNRFQNE